MPINNLGNDTIPLEKGLQYRLVPLQGTQWVEIYAMDRKYVWYRGLDEHETDQKVRKTQFDDNISEWRVPRLIITTEDSLFSLATEDSFTIDWRL